MKLLDKIQWSWWWVLSPLWIAVAVAVAIVIIGLLIAIIKEVYLS